MFRGWFDCNRKPFQVLLANHRCWTYWMEIWKATCATSEFMHVRVVSIVSHKLMNIATTKQLLFNDLFHKPERFASQDQLKLEISHLSPFSTREKMQQKHTHVWPLKSWAIGDSICKFSLHLHPRNPEIFGTPGPWHLRNLCLVHMFRSLEQCWRTRGKQTYTAACCVPDKLGGFCYCQVLWVSKSGTKLWMLYFLRYTS